MSRNKNPEETEKLILDVSYKLFTEKGYDETSLQDIIDNLGGLSKGAIYHHFESKESILIAVYKRFSKTVEDEMHSLIDDPTLTGLEKLQSMFMGTVKISSQQKLIASTPSLLDNPKLLAIQLQSTILDVIPNYVIPVIKQGIKDGSIKTEYPEQLAEILILFSNVWMNPLIFQVKDFDEINKRLELFTKITESLGVNLSNQGLVENLKEIDSMSKKRG